MQLAFSWKSPIIKPVEQALARLRLRLETWNKLVVTAVFLLTLGWLLNTPAGLLGKADAVGYAVCHRIDLRSFNLGERQMPLCARCTGMYLGAVLGLYDINRILYGDPNVDFLGGESELVGVRWK